MNYRSPIHPGAAMLLALVAGRVAGPARAADFRVGVHDSRS